MTKKRLTRSRINRTFLGVCGGVAEYFDLDPTIVRLAWALVSLCSFGVGVIGYFIAALIIPEDIA